jgi:hypothetical protein
MPKNGDTAASTPPKGFAMSASIYAIVQSVSSTIELPLST